LKALSDIIDELSWCRLQQHPKWVDRLARICSPRWLPARAIEAAQNRSFCSSAFPARKVSAGICRSSRGSHQIIFHPCLVRPGHAHVANKALHASLRKPACPVDSINRRPFLPDQARIGIHVECSPNDQCLRIPSASRTERSCSGVSTRFCESVRGRSGRYTATLFQVTCSTCACGRGCHRACSMVVGGKRRQRTSIHQSEFRPIRDRN